jgi:hypothetical protein
VCISYRVISQVYCTPLLRPERYQETAKGKRAAATRNLGSTRGVRPSGRTAGQGEASRSARKHQPGRGYRQRGKPHRHNRLM